MLSPPRTASAFAWNHIARTGDYLLMYLTSVVIARSLGAELFGAYAMFLSASQMLIVVSSFGMETVILSGFPRAGTDTPAPGTLPHLRRLLAIRLTGIVLVSIGLLLTQAAFTRFAGFPSVLTNYIVVLLLFFCFRNLVAFFGAVHISTLRTERLAIISLSARALEVAGIIILFRLGAGLPGVLILLTASASMQLAALLPMSGILRRAPLQKRGDTVRMIDMGGKFWLSGIMEFLLGRQADVILLGIFLVGKESIGHYDAALGLGQGINVGMTAGFIGVATASFASMTGRDRSVLRSSWDFLARLALLLTVPPLVLAMVAADIVIPLLYTRDYLAGSALFQVFGLFLVLTRFLGGGLAANLLTALGRPEIILRSSVVSGGANLLLALALIPVVGVWGAVVATGVGALAIAWMQAHYAARYAGISLPWRFGLAITFISVVSAYAGRLVVAWIPLSGLAGLALGFAVAFVLLSYVLKPLPGDDYDRILDSTPAIARIVSPFVRISGPVSENAADFPPLTDRQKWAYAWLGHPTVVVDVGCSDSPLVQWLHRKAERVVGLDIDGDALQRMRGMETHATFVEASALKMPFRSGTIDAVLLLDVLERLPGDRAAIEEVNRVLRPGGTLILSVPHAGLFAFLDPQNLSARLRGTLDRVAEHRHYSVDDISRLLEGRFSIRRKRYGGLFLYPMTFAAEHFIRTRLRIDAGRLLRRLGDLDNDVSWGKWSYNLIVQADKPPVEHQGGFATRPGSARP